MSADVENGSRMTLGASPAGALTVAAPPVVHGEAAVAALPLERVNAPIDFLHGFVATARDIWRFRELLGYLVRKELKVKYKGSTLGFLWTLLRPLFMLMIYDIAFGTFLQGGRTPDYVVFLFSGLVPWTLFSDIAVSSTQAIVANGGLIKKVYFPREILPLSVIGASLVQFVFQLVVLFGAVFVTGRSLSPGPLLLLPVTVIALLIFATAVGLLLSAANVYLRDTAHLIEVVLQAWFFLTPIIYSYGQVAGRISGVSRLLLQGFLANPMAIVVLGFQRAVYQSAGPGVPPPVYTGDIWAREGLLIVAALAFLWLAQRVFAKAQGSFAQEL